MLLNNYYYFTMCSNKNISNVKIFKNIESAYSHCIDFHNKSCCENYYKKLDTKNVKIDTDLIFSSLFVCACEDKPNSPNNKLIKENDQDSNQKKVQDNNQDNKQISLSNVNYKDIIDEYIFSTNYDEIKSKYLCTKCNSNLLECAICQTNIYDLVKKLDSDDAGKIFYFGENKINYLMVKKINFYSESMSNLSPDTILDFEIKN